MKLKWHFILFLFLVFTISSCDKLFVDGVEGTDTDLQGKWQLTSDKGVYYNFQNNLFEYQKYIKKDSILGVYGYYTIIGDTAIYLELLAESTEINVYPATYPLDFLGWDTIPGINATDTLVQQFSLRFVTNKELRLSNASKSYDFRKF